MGADYQRLGGLNGRVQRSSPAERCLQTEVVWALTVIAETVASADREPDLMPWRALL
jgi:hypothetical protein